MAQIIPIEHLQQLRTWFEDKVKEKRRPDQALRIEAITLILDARESEQEKLPFDDAPAARPSECRSCRAPIYWIETPAGKKMPVDCDVDGGCEPWKGVPGDGERNGRGVSHFSTCADADQWRKAR